MTEVYIVTETATYNHDTTVVAVMDTQVSADRWVSIQRNEHPDSEVDYGVRRYTVGTVSEEIFRDSENFFDIVDAAEWQRDHKMTKDDAYVGNIKRRRTCTKCGSSVIQFEDGTVKDQGTDEPCSK